jgi:hypothetical protein
LAGAFASWANAAVAETESAKANAKAVRIELFSLPFGNGRKCLACERFDIQTAFNHLSQRKEQRMAAGCD